MKSIAFAAVVLLIGIQGALAIRCYECAPEFNDTSSLQDALNRSRSKNICGNPNKTIDCPMYDSCGTMKLTGRKAGIGEFTIYSLNCTTQMMCSSANKNMTCADMKIATDAAGAELVNCELKCCQGDLCNKPVVPSTSPGATTPRGSTTTKSAARSINFPLNRSAIFGILNVITLVFMNIF